MRSKEHCSNKIHTMSKTHKKAPGMITIALTSLREFEYEQVRSLMVVSHGGEVVLVLVLLVVRHWGVVVLLLRHDYLTIETSVVMAKQNESSFSIVQQCSNNPYQRIIYSSIC